MKKTTATDWSLLLVRLALAMVLLYHGTQKAFGWFDGRGYQAVLEGWTARHGWPIWFAWLGIIGEVAGGLGLAAGLFTRVAAFGAACTMATAAYTHIKGGDPWTKVEVPLALALFSVAILVSGAGSLSLDKVFFGKRKKR